MTFEEALAYLYDHEDRERLSTEAAGAPTFDLRRVSELLDRLGTPQAGRLTVHIAGSKGKGSVAAMLAAVLTAAGKRTGLYTSPHLCDFRERIRVDGEAIAPEAFARVVGEVREAAEAYHRDASFGRLTTFELSTACAFLHFRDEATEAMVLETGMGGRLDATNAIPTPDVAVITPISLEHTAILGPTVAAIAAEKAGIIKRGGVVVMAPQEPEAGAVIARRCYEVGARLVDVQRRTVWRRLSHGLDGQAIHVRVPSLGYQDTTRDTLGNVGLGLGLDLHIPLLGEFQVENAAVAVTALEVLRERGLTLRREHLEAGLRESRWPGRLQVVNTNPLILLDGAHNPASAKRLAETLRHDFLRAPEAGETAAAAPPGTQPAAASCGPWDRAGLVVGLSADKDADGFAAALAPIVDWVIATRATGPRAATPDTVAAAFVRAGVNTLISPDVAGALEMARPRMDSGTLLCITGSLYLVGDALRHFGLQESVLDLTPASAGAVAGVLP